MKRRLPPEPGDGYSAGNGISAIQLWAMQEALTDPIFRDDFTKRTSRLPPEDQRLALDFMESLDAGDVPDEFETSAALSVGPLQFEISLASGSPEMTVIFEDR